MKQWTKEEIKATLASNYVGLLELAFDAGQAGNMAEFEKLQEQAKGIELIAESFGITLESLKMKINTLHTLRKQA